MVPFIKHLLDIWNPVGHLVFITPPDPTNPRFSTELLFPYHPKVPGLPKVIQLRSGRAGIWTYASVTSLLRTTPLQWCLVPIRCVISFSWSKLLQTCILPATQWKFSRIGKRRVEEDRNSRPTPWATGVSMSREGALPCCSTNGQLCRLVGTSYCKAIFSRYLKARVS